MMTLRIEDGLKARRDRLVEAMSRSKSFLAAETVTSAAAASR